MEVSDLVKSLLAKRGIVKDEEIKAFLSPDYEAHTHSPELLLGIKKAVSRLLLAIEKNERIAIYADFDCDGIPGAAIISDFFVKMGYSNFEVYLPHRDREGYGFHIDAIKKLAERDVKLIITVDVGTTAHGAVSFAKEKDIDVIVTDHHELMHSEKLPKAVAVLNPKLGEYPFRDLCGSAVAFKLVQATIAQGKRQGIPSFVAIQEGWEKWLLDLVAIATIADMVPLIGENRALAFWGLQVLRKSQRPGIRALCTRMRLRMAGLSEDDIGFSIAPRINAASRMDEPDLAFRLLTTHDSDEAEKLASHLEELNASRKGKVGAIVKEARKKLAAREKNSPRVTVLGDAQWKPALLGLAANSIMGDRGGVVCLWGRDANGNLKGSCRSDGSIALTDLFVAAADVFIESGGHQKSGGFSISHENVHTLQETLDRIAGELDMTAQSEREHEHEIVLREISLLLLRDVERLAPFGIGNPKPVFLISRATVSGVKSFGKENNHVELTLLCSESGMRIRAFEFFKHAEQFTGIPAPGVLAHIIATVERDNFRGADKLALRLLDVLPA
jgi:single-stranded-DNA-specific exonuclease